jgi:transaldolase
MNRLQQLHEAGVSIWLDTLSRDLLESGDFQGLVDRGVTGATSNPTIFAKAITSSDAYDDQLREAYGRGIHDPKELFFDLGLDDIRAAAGVLRRVHDDTDGYDGYVSFECTPDLAYDAEGTIEQAQDLWGRLDLPDVLIKVPATEAGLTAIEELTARGINVNVTLLFSLERYEQVMDAYMSGLERRVEAGEPVDRIASVASFFVSRVDTKADKLLPEDSPLRGRIAVANAHLAYQRYERRFESDRWKRLDQHGATRQRPLWASTGTKNPDYSDVLYVEDLIAPGVVNTMPLATIEAFADHGDVGKATDVDVSEDERVIREAADAGVDLDAVTSELEREGVESFMDSYRELLDCIQGKLRRVEPRAA